MKSSDFLEPSLTPSQLLEACDGEVADHTVRTWRNRGFLDITAPGRALRFSGSKAGYTPFTATLVLFMARTINLEEGVKFFAPNGYKEIDPSGFAISPRGLSKAVGNILFAVGERLLWSQEYKEKLDQGISVAYFEGEAITKAISEGLPKEIFDPDQNGHVLLPREGNSAVYERSSIHKGMPDPESRMRLIGDEQSCIVADYGSCLRTVINNLK